MAYISPEVDESFLFWLNKDSWNSGHPLDMARFYRFIKDLRKSDPAGYWIGPLRPALEQALSDIRPQMDREHRAEAVSKYVQYAEVIHGYEAS
jgi:hypothetical protein